MYGLVQGGSYDYFNSGGTPPDVTAPIISNIQVINITETEATITWDTNEPSTSVVDYGLTAGYGSQQSSGSLVTSHSVNLTGLTQGTTYHYKVTSVDAATNSASSTDATFDTDAAVINNALVADGAGDRASRNSGGFYATNIYSMCLWMYREADSNSFCTLWGLQDGSGNYIYLYSANSDGTTITFENQLLETLGSFASPANAWTFIGISKAGSGSNQTKVYRRAIGDVALTSVTGQMSDNITPTQEIVLNNLFDAGTGFANGFFPGRIAALKQWNGVALSEAEMLAESNHYSPQRLTNLFSFYPMNDDTVAEQVLDQGGSNRHFTAAGTLLTEEGPPIPFA